MAHQLNPAQREAVQTAAGPLLVLAGAGTGKTRVVTYRIAELIRRGTPAGRILGVTFTNKAAGEMRQRIRGILGKQREFPEISTFHSHCVRILRRHIQHLNYPTRFAIYDRRDQLSVARGVLREIRVATNVLRPDDLLAIIGSWKSNSIRADQAERMAETDRQHVAAVGYRRYQKALRSMGAVDFDDLLLLTDDLFSQHSGSRREEAARFDQILIDEYQDTSSSQYRIIKALAVGHRNLCVVGDDDQSIYGWRGAEVEHILRFKKDWPDAKVVRLQENYRSSMEILQVANRLIEFNKKRFDKQLHSARIGGERPQVLQFRDETKEAEAIVADIYRWVENRGISPRDIAVLFRTNEQPRAFESELRRAQLPYTLVGGSSFFDRKEVRDLLAYIKVLSSPQDEVSLLRIINLPPRGIGVKTVNKILEAAVSSGISVWELMERPGELPELPVAALQSLDGFRSLIKSLRRNMGKRTVVDIVRNTVERIGYREEMERIYSDPHEFQSRWASVEELINAAATFDERSESETALEGFLDDLTLDAQDRESDKEKNLNQNAITLMTLHAAKGLEFPHVYMVGMEEGILPHHRSLKDNEEDVDEERRLCYVGVTRAQDRLTFSMAQSRRKWGKPRLTQPSRFLYELTGQAEGAHTSETATSVNQIAAPAARRKAKRKSLS